MSFALLASTQQQPVPQGQVRVKIVGMANFHPLRAILWHRTAHCAELVSTRVRRLLYRFLIVADVQTARHQHQAAMILVIVSVSRAQKTEVQVACMCQLK